MTAPDRWTFGEAPLPETVALAAALRDLADCALALEHPEPALRGLVEQVAAVTAQLDLLRPLDLTPRIGGRTHDQQRVYLDHSRDIGDFNPCVPRYALACADGRAEGEVEFPVVYEGPPGLVHGGFLALLFDCVLQQLNCDLGVAGKTMTLNVRYRRPTPLLTKLRIVAARDVADGRITSEAGLYRDEDLLCVAEMTAVASSRDALPAVSPRRAAP